MREKFTRYERRFEETISKELKNVLSGDLEYRYQMLGRFKSDADYYFRNPHPKHLWAGDAEEHADNMLAIYKSFKPSEKPEWLTDKELKKYVDKLKST